MRKRVGESGVGSAKSDSHVSEKEERGTSPGSVTTRSGWWAWMKRGLIGFFVIYVSAAFAPRLFPVRVPFFTDLSRPADLSLNHTLNMYLTPEDGITVAVWHTVPDSLWEEAQGKGPDWYKESLANGAPIFIYLHGNGGTRGASHRVGLVKVLSATGYHVLSLDYRGFAESTGEPTEPGLTTDALYLYQWVKAHSGNSLVCIWGHSLGTGVATNMALKLQEQGTSVDGVIIESPFTNARHAGKNHPFAWFYFRFPWFDYFFLDPLKDNHVFFTNDDNLRKLKIPLLILHAEDDLIVPFHMGQELYDIARSAQNSEERVKMVRFNKELGYVHNGSYKDPRMPAIIREFVESLSS
ncbi:lysophosphatidylserine lipase ABHD12 isoform X2 [Chanos chanos]|uniref:Lysophosphatidylserine lipase ABHD12 isoform X2 n=1 Tax=Chanos chanos TaxID=29144 RepID=A0A6J2V4F8_CHACN|nr:lysophosphatidylserine lipase ABHD12-like isoform X2 [Chanos chanos]